LSSTCKEYAFAKITILDEWLSQAHESGFLWPATIEGSAVRLLCVRVEVSAWRCLDTGVLILRERVQHEAMIGQICLRHDHISGSSRLWQVPRLESASRHPCAHHSNNVIIIQECLFFRRPDNTKSRSREARGGLIQDICDIQASTTILSIPPCLEQNQRTL
jgi:hypothetical protein